MRGTKYKGAGPLTAHKRLEHIERNVTIPEPRLIVMGIHYPDGNMKTIYSATEDVKSFPDWPDLVEGRIEVETFTANHPGMKVF